MDILTQDEINALLSSIGSDEETLETKMRLGIRKIVKPFDFRSPDKFSKVQLKTLEMIHEVFAQRLSVYLSTYFMVPTKVTLQFIEQVTFESFINSLPTPTVMATFTMAPLQGACLLAMNPVLALSMLDRVYGGPGKFTGESRELTEIEQLLMGKVLSRFLASLRESWSHLLELSPKLDGLHMNPQFVQIISPKDATSVLSFQISMPKTSEKLILCFPYLTLQPVMERLSTRQWFSEKRNNTNTQRAPQLEKRLQYVRLPLTVELGTATVTARELIELEVGDIIKLDTRPDQSLTLYVGNYPKFLGKVGFSGRRLAVRIMGIYP